MQIHEKITRIMQITRDLSSCSSILDLACGQGLYALEAARRFPAARIHATDARSERMDLGRSRAKEEGLHCTFEQIDVRDMSVASHGRWEVIYFLGILYHLDFPDAVAVLERIGRMCGRLLIIDTHVSLRPRKTREWNGLTVRGHLFREHRRGSSPEKKEASVRASIDNDYSFWLTEQSIMEILGRIGFSSAYRCMLPAEPGKPKDRVTLVAVK